MSFVIIEGDVFQLDNEGNPIAPDAGVAAVALPATQGGVLIAAKDSVSGKPVLVKVSSDGTVSVSVASLPLPAGAATEAKQDTVIGHVDGIEGLLTSLDGKDYATQTTLAAVLAQLDVALSTRSSEATLVAVDAVLDTIFTRLNDRSQRSILSSGAKGTSVAADITSEPIDADTEALHVNLKGGGAGLGRVEVWDGTDVLDVLAEAVSTAGLKGLLPLAKTAQAVSTFLLAQPDGALVTANKPPAAPPGTTPYQSSVDEAELDVGNGGDVASPHTTLGPIVSNGDTLTLQSVEVGTEGDSSENGSVVEVYWREGVGPTDHLVGRFYVAGETVQVVLPDVSEARDGTAFLGDGSTTRIVTIRRRLSLAALEIDFVVRGYTS